MKNKNKYSASISALSEVFFTHPLDVYKTIYQQNKNYKPYHFLKEGLKFKYKGLIPRIIGVIPMRNIFWISQDYATTKSFYIPQITNGLFTAICQTTIDTPIENMKISYINQHKILINTLYTGCYYTCIRNSIFAISLYNIIHTNNDIPPFILGGIGGAIGSILSQPIDYLKTHIQSNSKLTCKDLWEHRYLCMNGGMFRALQGTMSMSIGLGMYNLCKQLFSRY